MECTINLSEKDQLLKASDIAKILNISRAMAYRLMQMGEIRTISIGTAKRVRIQDLSLYVESNLSPKTGE